MVRTTPDLGVLTGIIVPNAVFTWLYLEDKGKREAVIEIAKHLEDPVKVERLIGLFDERKKRLEITGGAVSKRCLLEWVPTRWVQYLSGVFLRELAC